MVRSLPLAAVALAAFAQPPAATSPSLKMPALKARATAQAVLDEHLDALNHCDWNRLMAQYPDDVEIFLPAGTVLKGRQAVGDAFRTMVKPFAQGGLCGLTFTPEHSFTVGETINVQYRVTGEPLAEPYRGADSYEAKNGLMQAQVSTFDRAQLKLKTRR